MDYDKIIILLVIILVVVAVGGLLLFNSSNNNTSEVVNNTPSSVNADKVNTEDSVSSNSGNSQQSSSGDSKYVSKEYAQQHMDEWNSGRGYYWVGDTQYDSATGKIIGGGSAEDQKALQEIMGDKE